MTNEMAFFPFPNDLWLEDGGVGEHPAAPGQSASHRHNLWKPADKAHTSL